MNTAIAAMMTAVNEMTANGVTKGDMGILLRLLNPFAPHITEELWEQLGFAAETGKMCCQAEWPVYDASKTVASSVEMAIQVNGKMKGTVTVAGGQRRGDRQGRRTGCGQGAEGHRGDADRQDHSGQEPSDQPDRKAPVRESDRLKCGKPSNFSDLRKNP